MWSFRKKEKQAREDEIKAIHQNTFAKIDQATESIDRNAASLDKLNKILEEKGDIAYNIFMATGGKKRIKQ